MSQPPGHPYFLSGAHKAQLQKITRGLANRAMVVFLAAACRRPEERFAQRFIRGLVDSSRRDARAPFLQSELIDAVLLGHAQPVTQLVLAATAHLSRPLSSPLELELDGSAWHDPVRQLTVICPRLRRALVFDDRVELKIEGGSTAGCTVTLRAGQRLPQVSTRYPIDDLQIVWARNHLSGLPGVPVGARWAGPSQRATLVPLREAAAVLCAALPGWVSGLAHSVERVDLFAEAGGSWAPRRLALPTSARHPLAAAEALIRSEQENRVRCSALLSPQSDTTTLVAAAADTMVAAFYSQLVSIGHPQLNSALLRRRERGMAALARPSDLPQITPTDRLISGGIEALNAWCRRIPNHAVRHQVVVRSRRLLVISLDFDDFVYSWMLEHRLVEAAARCGHLIDLIAVDPMEGRDLVCELGLEALPPTVFQGSELRFAHNDPATIFAAIDRLLAAHRYDGVVLNTRASVLAHLVNHPQAPLRDVPISIYDRHFHRDIPSLEDEVTRSNLRAHRLRLFCLRFNTLNPHPALGLANVGFSGSRLEHTAWPMDLPLLAPEPVATSTSEAGLKLFGGGNSGRDYEVLFGAVEGSIDRVRVASTLQLKPSEAVTLLGRLTLSAFAKEVGEADVIVVSLIPNADITGITVVALAMALGKPCVATHTPALLQYITPGVDGLTVPQGDQQALRRALDQLRDPATRARLGAAARARAVGWSVEGFVSRMLAFIEHPTASTDLVPVPKAISIRDPDPVRHSPLHVVLASRPRGWDRAQMLDLRATLVSRGVRVELLFAKTLSDEGLELIRADPDLIVVSSFGNARELYELAWRAQLPAPRAVKVVDFHMLNRSEELSELFGRPGARRMEGTWWPGHSLSVISAYPGFVKLYRNAGVRPGSVDFTGLPAAPSSTPVGPDPAHCDYFFGSVGNQREPKAYAAAVATIPTLHHQARFYGNCDVQRMVDAKIIPLPWVEYGPFLDIVQNARFIVINFAVLPNCTAGLSLANLASLMARPLIITDAAPVRDNFGSLEHVLFVPPGDTAALSEAIALLDRDDALVSALYQAALRWREGLDSARWADIFLDPLLVWRAPCPC